MIPLSGAFARDNLNLMDKIVRHPSYLADKRMIIKKTFINKVVMRSWMENGNIKPNIEIPRRSIERFLHRIRENLSYRKVKSSSIIVRQDGYLTFRGFSGYVLDGLSHDFICNLVEPEFLMIPPRRDAGTFPAIYYRRNVLVAALAFCLETENR